VRFLCAVRTGATARRVSSGQRHICISRRPSVSLLLKQVAWAIVCEKGGHMKRPIFFLFVVLACTQGCGAGTNNMSGNSSSESPGRESSARHHINRIQRQLTELAQQRTTPDQAVNSYIAAQALLEELACYRFEAGKEYPEIASSETETIDRFFSGAALESRQTHRSSLRQCLDRRDRILLDIRDVNMDTATHATITVNLKNVTPIPAGAEGDQYQRERRRDGQDYRIQLTKASDGWKVMQAYTSYSEGGEEYRTFRADPIYPDGVLSVFF
jgi:hypothetical protein